MNPSFLNDLAGIVLGAIRVADALKEEAKALLDRRVTRLAAKMDLVSRQEFNIAKDMACKARQDSEILKERLQDLQREIESLKK